MNNVANKRVLMERTHALIKNSNPDLAAFTEVAKALSQVMTDSFGIQMTLSLKFDPKALDVAIAEAEARERGDI